MEDVRSTRSGDSRAVLRRDLRAVVADVSGSRASSGPADRRELRRAAGSDGDGGPKPRPRLGVLPAAARHGSVPELLRGRAADLRVARGRSQAIGTAGLIGGGPGRLGLGLGAGGLGALRAARAAREALASRSWPFSSSRSFRSRSGTGAPSSPTPRCSAPPWPAWPAGIGRSRAAAGTGSLAGWCLLALGFAIKITSAFLLDSALVDHRPPRPPPGDGRGLLDAGSRHCCGMCGPTT